MALLTGLFLLLVLSSCKAEAPPHVTAGSIAVENLEHQIARAELGGRSSREALVELLLMRSQLLGRHAALDRAVELTETASTELSATIVAIGEARPLIADALGSSCVVHEAADMSAAVRTAFASASPGQTVLLAPACASFDMFRDYAERGRVFKQEVRRLGEEWNVTREQ